MKSYRIAVCDDESNSACHIANVIQQSFNDRHVPVEMDAYTDSQKLEQQLNAGESFDILFLDIDMPGLNGIELCRHLRARKQDTLVVFISNKAELVFQSFEVSPFRFVRKSHFHLEINQTCKDLIAELERRKDSWLRFYLDRGDTVYTLNAQTLMYVEAADKFCRFVTTEEERTIRVPFSDVCSQLEELAFIQIHRGIIVNPYYIFLISKDFVQLDNGCQLPMSRNRKNDVRNLYFAWRRNET